MQNISGREGRCHLSSVSLSVVKPDLPLNHRNALLHPSQLIRGSCDVELVGLNLMTAMEGIQDRRDS